VKCRTLKEPSCPTVVIPALPNQLSGVLPHHRRPAICNKPEVPLACARVHEAQPNRGRRFTIQFYVRFVTGFYVKEANFG